MISLYMIGLGLILMHSLTSSHLIGRDVFQEFNCFQLTLTNFHWNIDNFYNPYNACISITILPTIYAVLTNLNGEYVFKLLFALVGSILPLMVYKIATKYLTKKNMHFASLLFYFPSFLYKYSRRCKTRGCHTVLFFMAVIVYLTVLEIRNLKNHWLKNHYF